MTSASEQDWTLLRCSRHDAQAIHELFVRHRDFVFRLAWSFNGDRETAEDIVQDVFLRLYKVPLHMRATAKFTTWLYRVALNVSREARRAPVDIKPYYLRMSSMYRPMPHAMLC